MKPSDVALLDPCPLTGTFKHAEAEAAAAYLLLAMRRGPDTFRAVGAREVGTAAGLHRKAKGFAWLTNPFFRPDFDKLIEVEAAVLTEPDKGRESPLEFTAAGLAMLRRSVWVPRVRCPECEAEILDEDGAPYVRGEAMKYRCEGCDHHFEGAPK